MPYSEPGKKREYDRARRQANLREIREKERARREANPDQKRETNRRYRGANQSRIREHARAYRRVNTEKIRLGNLERKHGPRAVEAVGVLWQTQDGRCYMCGEHLTPTAKATHIDHDHTHCGFNSCAVCRRGLACMRCNLMIGLVRDDADLLRLIADNFEPVFLATRARIAAAPQQQDLFDEEAG